MRLPIGRRGHDPLDGFRTEVLVEGAVTTEQSRAHGTKGAAHELMVGEKRR